MKRKMLQQEMDFEKQKAALEAKQEDDMENLKASSWGKCYDFILWSDPDGDLMIPLCVTAAEARSTTVARPGEERQNAQQCTK